MCWRGRQSQAQLAASAPPAAPAAAVEAPAQPKAQEQPAEAPAEPQQAAAEAASPEPAAAEKPDEDRPVQVRAWGSTWAGWLDKAAVAGQTHAQPSIAHVPAAARRGACAPASLAPNPPPLSCPLQENRGRCFCCRKKVGLLGFECR